MNSHFIKRKQESFTLKNGWVVTMRRMSAKEKADIDARLMTAEIGSDGKVSYKLDLIQQAPAYNEAIAASIIKIVDGDNVGTAFSADEIGELESTTHAEMRDLFDDFNGLSKNKDSEGKGEGVH